MKRLLWRGLVGAAAVAVALKLLTLGLADHAVRTRNGPLLEALAPVSPHAAARAAEARFAAGDVAGAEVLARRALDGAPFNAAALRTLGFSFEAQGKLEPAARAMALAGGLGWRDTPTQLWLIDAFARQGDFASALERADALARRRQHLAEMNAIFMGAALDPSARPVLMARLAEQPPWRRGFFDAVRSVPPELYDEFARFLDAVGRNDGLDPDEAAPFVTLLYDRRRYREADRVWRLHGRGRGNGADPVSDGAFAHSELNPKILSYTDADGRKNYGVRPLTPFEWHFPQPVGSETRLAPSPWEASGRALGISSPGNARLEVARQSVTLAPGRHVLAFDAAADTPSDAYSWIVECLPAGPALVLDSPASTRLRTGAMRVSRGFEIPGHGCEAQRLLLVLRSGSTGASRPTTLWFDNIAIEAR